MFINQLKIDDTLYFSFSGSQLFSILNNNFLFCFKKSKSTEWFICGKKQLENINELKPLHLLTVII